MIYFQHFSFYEQLKLYAQHEKSFITLGSDLKTPLLKIHQNEIISYNIHLFSIGNNVKHIW